MYDRDKFDPNGPYDDRGFLIDDTPVETSKNDISDKCPSKQSEDGEHVFLLTRRSSKDWMEVEYKCTLCGKVELR